MPYKILSRNEHLAVTPGGAKRILALDGGGLRGILTLGMLKKVETILRDRHGADFRLCHYFDLIAGTSTGAIIAAALAIGMTVDEVIEEYQRLGRDVFQKSWTRQGFLRARYDEATLISNLRRVFGTDRTLGDEDIRTGLLIITKRFDTGSVWPLGNNPQGKYFKAKAGDNWLSNGDFLLWKVVRASTAAPSFFDPEQIQISSSDSDIRVMGTFVDGGVSPNNNPSLQALMYATLEGFRLRWPTGPDKLLLVSLGTGSSDASQTPSQIAAKGAIKSLFSIMDDCAALVETLMQWISRSPVPRVIDRELGDLANDLLHGQPVLSYLRYNVTLSPDEIQELRPGTPKNVFASLGEMDNPDNLDLLLDLGLAAGHLRIRPEHFPASFDLPGPDVHPPELTR